MTQPPAPVLADVLGFSSERGQALFSKTGVTEKKYHQSGGQRTLWLIGTKQKLSRRAGTGANLDLTQ